MNHQQLHCRKFAYEQEIISQELESSLLQKWSKNQDSDSLTQLVRSHLRLIHSLAYRFRRYSVDYHDLIQEGLSGLIKAAHDFDFQENCRFATYARFWILSKMQNFVTESHSIVKTTTNATQRRLFFRLSQLERQLAHLGHFEKDTEIAKTLNTTISQVQEMRDKLGSPDVSFDNLLAGDIYHQSFTDPNPLPEDIAVQKELEILKVSQISAALDEIPWREALIIKKRFLEESPQTLEDIGKDLKLTKERIRQLEKSALRTLRYALKAQKLNDFKDDKES